MVVVLCVCFLFYTGNTTILTFTPMRVGILFNHNENCAGQY